MTNIQPGRWMPPLEAGEVAAAGGILYVGLARGIGFKWDGVLMGSNFTLLISSLLF